MADPDSPTETSGAHEAVFDIYQSYVTLRHDLPPALASVAALTDGLKSNNDLGTIVEALSLLSSLNEKLKSALKNPIPAGAGTDSFLHYLVNTVAKTGSEGPEDINFEKTLKRILTTADIFVKRAIEHEQRIGTYGRWVIKDGDTVIVPIIDRAIVSTLTNAAEAKRDFRVVFVHPDTTGTLGEKASTKRKVEELEDIERTFAKVHEISTRRIHPTGLANYLCHRVSHGFNKNETNVARQPSRRRIFLIGAEAILPNGSVLGGLGTFQACILANYRDMEVYAAAPLWKCAKWLPLSGDDDEFTWRSQLSQTGDGDEMLDVTPPNLIKSFITENGLRRPETIAEESIQFWF